MLQIIVRVHTEECFLMRDKDKNYNELSSEIMQTVKIMEVIIMLGKHPQPRILYLANFSLKVKEK